MRMTIFIFGTLACLFAGFFLLGMTGLSYMPLLPGLIFINYLPLLIFTFCVHGPSETLHCSQRLFQGKPNLSDNHLINSVVVQSLNLGAIHACAMQVFNSFHPDEGGPILARPFLALIFGVIPAVLLLPQKKRAGKESARV